MIRVTQHIFWHRNIFKLKLCLCKPLIAQLDIFLWKTLCAVIFLLTCCLLKLWFFFLACTCHLRNLKHEILSKCIQFYYKFGKVLLKSWLVTCSGWTTLSPNSRNNSLTLKAIQWVREMDGWMSTSILCYKTTVWIPFLICKPSCFY